MARQEPRHIRDGVAFNRKPLSSPIRINVTTGAILSCTLLFEGSCVQELPTLVFYNAIIIYKLPGRHGASKLNLKRFVPQVILVTRSLVPL